MITIFKGKDRQKAIANTLSLDIEEEKDFVDFIHGIGYTINDNDQIIIGLHEMWENNGK